MERENEDYDFEERAAIREFDGDQPRGTAEFFAHEEIAARMAQQGCLARRKQNIKGTQEISRKPNRPIWNNQPERQELKDLLSRREKISGQMKTEKNEQKKKELLDEWMNLSRQIIELRKGS
jgi:shikimate kinase